jgi:hypothetical protein
MEKGKCPANGIPPKAGENGEDRRELKTLSSWLGTKHLAFLVITQNKVSSLPVPRNKVKAERAFR